MLNFKIFEIPEGRSERSVELSSDDLDLGDIPLKEGKVDISFYRTEHFVQTEFHVHAVVGLICDRSLDAFDYTVDQDFEVLFKAEEVEESSDVNGAIRNYDHGNRQIDLEQDVMDTILLNLPTKKLHPRFLDENGEPKEFTEQQFGKSEEDEEAIDPRWEKLKDLKE
ncbi:DUF177 domain-containing protein [Balneola sp. MJW-20]|uniref:YceD family protein n=1 Tax=Gracilimonas aurantiaca TaxID=3234185 RepID=UPI003466403A